MLGLNALQKENVNARDRSLCENSNETRNSKILNWNTTLKILLCESQSDLPVIEKKKKMDL